MGKHRMRETTEEIDKVVVIERAVGQHRAPISWLATASFGLALTSLLVGWLLLGIPSVIATVFAVKAFKDTEGGKSEGHFVAQCALIMGVAGIVIGAIVAIAVLR